MTLRCILDGLILPAQLGPGRLNLLAFDGPEPFRLEALEAAYYQLLAASPSEERSLERHGYRLLRRAPDFQPLPG